MAGKELIARGDERRAEILAFLRDYCQTYGWAPTIAEVADAVGLSSTNGARLHLVRLAEQGYLRMAPYQARAIALASPAPDGWRRAA